MNRKHRRALERNHAETRHFRLHDTRADRPKHSHRLAPQICMLFVPQCGYLVSFSSQDIEAAKYPEDATKFDEDRVCSVATAFIATTGLKAYVRPWYGSNVAR